MKLRLLTISAFIIFSCGSASAKYLTKAEIEFMVAENTYELGRHAEAIPLFKKLIPKTDDQNKIDSAKIRIADCLYILGQRDRAISLYKSVFMDKRYSMIKTIAFWKWRTTYQLRYCGIEPDSIIPNKFYNKYRVRLHNRLKRQSLEHPLAVSPISQMNFLSELPNLRYDEKRGPMAIVEFRSLYPEFVIRPKKPRKNS